MRIFSRTIFLTLFSFFLFRLSGQDIPFRNYTIRDGLPQNSVMTVFQDSHGYVWFGTQVGAARFDGKSFFTLSISQGLCGNLIIDILEDKTGKLWFAARDGGICAWDGKHFEVYRKDDGLISNQIKSLFLDKSGEVWCLSDSGISVIQGKRIRSFNENNGLPHNNILTIFQDSRERIWIGTQNGAASCTSGNWTKYVSQLSYPVKGKMESVVWSIAEDNEGKIWLGTQGGGVFVTSDGKNFRNYRKQDGLAGDYVMSMASDSSGNIWMGHFASGITRVHQNQFITYAESLLPDDYIRGICFDRKGNLWARTLHSGVILGNERGFRLVGKGNNLIDDQVQDIFVDNTGNVWIGTLGGVSMYGKGIFEIYNTDHGLPRNNIISVVCTHDHSVWMGTYNELVRLKDHRVDTFSQQKDLLENAVLSLFEDHRNNLWIGSYGALIRRTGNIMFKIPDRELYRGDNGIYAFTEIEGNIWLATESGAFYGDGNSFIKFGAEEGLTGVSSIISDGKGNIWFASSDGVLVKTPQKFLRFNTNSGLPSNSCTQLATDKKQHVWVGTDAGVAEFVPSADSFIISKIYNRKNGLASNTIYSLLYDHRNNLWIGHEKGLNRINVLTGDVFYYGASDGFTPVETNLNAVSMDTDGHIWFGTVDGVVKYFPENDIVSSDPPRTYITAVRLSGSDIPISNFASLVDTLTGLPLNLKLPYNKSSLIFDFIGLHYTIPDKIQYQYKLEGYDDQWSEPTLQNFAEYKKLPNGHFRFLVKACNSDGVWNQDPAAFSFQIKPPFWKTWWFILSMIIFGVAIVIGIIVYRERKLQEDKRILEQKVQERTAQIEQQKKEIEEKNEELQQQQLEILAQRDEIERQRDIATQQRDQIALQKKEITDSIHYASRIQRAIVPSFEYVSQVIPDHFILFMPRDIVSGDFYWVTQHDHKIVIAAADCTGHGVPGAFMSMLGVTLLNEIVNKEDTFRASHILDKLRENVKTTLSQTGKEDEAKDGMDIALCVVDTLTRTLEFAGANNPLYIIRNSELLEYKGDNMPIGIHAGEERPFTNHAINIIPGDIFYIFSDGYADQFGGPEGTKFKTKPFKRLLLQIHDQPLTEQMKRLLENFEQWKGNLDQVDDVLVIGFRLT